MVKTVGGHSGKEAISQKIDYAGDGYPGQRMMYGQPTGVRTILKNVYIRKGEWKKCI